jgi:hypothetical protein
MTMDRILNEDVEKQPGGEKALFEDETGAVPASSFEFGDSTYAKLQRLGGKFKVEQRGIERVPEDERTDSSYWNIGSMVFPSHSSHFLMSFVLIVLI